MPQRHATVIGAAVLAAAHFAVAVLSLLQWSRNGERYSPWDMPLEALWRSFQPLNDFIMHGSTTRFVLFISVAGTIMYAALGAVIGYAFGWLFHRLRRSHTASYDI